MAFGNASKNAVADALRYWTQQRDQQNSLQQQIAMQQQQREQEMAQQLDMMRKQQEMKAVDWATVQPYTLGSKTIYRDAKGNVVSEESPQPQPGEPFEYQGALVQMGADGMLHQVVGRPARGGGGRGGSGGGGGSAWGGGGAMSNVGVPEGWKRIPTLTPGMKPSSDVVPETDRYGRVSQKQVNEGVKYGETTDKGTEISDTYDKKFKSLITNIAQYQKNRKVGTGAARLKAAQKIADELSTALGTPIAVEDIQNMTGPQFLELRRQIKQTFYPQATMEKERQRDAAKEAGAAAAVTPDWNPRSGKAAKSKTSGKQETRIITPDGQPGVIGHKMTPQERKALVAAGGKIVSG